MEEATEKSDSQSVKQSQVLSPLKNQNNKQGESSEEKDSTSQDIHDLIWNLEFEGSPSKVLLKEVKVTPTHSKKVIKHALRQQAKRRRKNTTIAAGISAPIQRLSLSPHCELEEISNETACYRQPTMAEVLSSIPGFSVKPRKRSNKKISAAVQLEQTKDGCVDLETPDSILVNSNLRSLLNKHTFHSLPPLYQYKLLQLLPHVDRVPVQTESMFRLSNSGLNNEFFARACLDWRERLAEGEFTVENQAKIKAEQEKEKSKLDPWKLKHFEPMWGESLREWPSLPPGALSTPGQTSLTSGSPPTRSSSQNHFNQNSTGGKNHNQMTSSKSSFNKINSSSKVNHSQQIQQQPPPPTLRTVGAVTRAVASYREKRLAEETNVQQIRPSKRTRPHSLEKETKAEGSDEIKEKVEIDQVEESDQLESSSKREKSPVEEQVEREEIKEEIIITNTTNELVEESKEIDETPAELEKEEEIDETPVELEKEEEIDEPEATLESESTTQDDDKEKEDISEESRESTSPETVSEFREEENDRESPEEKPKDESEQMEEALNEVEYSKKDLVCRDENIVIEEAVHLDVPSPLQTVEVQELEQVIVEEVVREVVQEVEEQMKNELERKQEEPQHQEEEEEEESNSRDDDEDKCPTEEKTLGDVVALEEEVADRIELSVKAEALQKTQSNLEEWEIIKVDPNQEGDTSSGLPTPGAHEDPMTSTSSTVERSKAPDYYGDILYQETLKEDEAALLAAAWDVVGSSTEFQDVNLNQPVSVIPCQEELEVRLQESSLPVPQWEYTSNQAKQPHGHVKLELEVTLTPEVDSQVSSTVEQTPSLGGCNSNERCSPVVSSADPACRTSRGGPVHVDESQKQTNQRILPTEIPVSIQQPQPPPQVTVIPPTTIVCLPPPPLFSTQATPQVRPPAPQGHHTTSSSSLPFIALTTSTPVRALPTKTISKGGVGSSGGGRGGGSRNSNKPPPGAVNLERSYQICQAVIQNSPNRHQLRCQLKPPPSILLGKSSTASGGTNSTVNSRTGTNNLVRQNIRQGPRQQVLLKHVFTSSHGIPVNMAVLPPQHNQVGEYMMVQRGVQVRRSNSAPPSNIDSAAGGGGLVHHRGGRPASVGGPRPPSSESAPPPPSLPPPVAPPPSYHHLMVPPQSTASSCPCSLKAMIACAKCGAFCHDDCITPHSRLCITCDTR